VPALSDLKSELTSLRARVSSGQQVLLEDWAPVLAGSDYVGDAANLAAYIAFRREDLRDLRLAWRNLAYLPWAAAKDMSPLPWMPSPCLRARK
jgi:hypothetical protein